MSDSLRSSGGVSLMDDWLIFFGADGKIYIYASMDDVLADAPPEIVAQTSNIGPMPGGGWGYSGAGTVQGDEYEALNPDEATRTLLEVYQGKYHRDSYQDRIVALEKDGIFLCRKK